MSLGARGFRGVAGYLGVKCSHGLVKLSLGRLSWWVYDIQVGGFAAALHSGNVRLFGQKCVGGMFASCCF